MSPMVSDVKYVPSGSLPRAMKGGGPVLNSGVPYGGYSESIVVDERFVLRVPENLDLAGVVPLLCAGITTYSPIRRWGDIQGEEGGCRWLGWPGAHGVEVRQGLRRPRGGLHHLTGQERGCPSSRCSRGDHLRRWPQTEFQKLTVPKLAEVTNIPVQFQNSWKAATHLPY